MLFNLTAIQFLTVVAFGVSLLPILFFSLKRIMVLHSEYVWSFPVASALLFVCVDINGKLVAGGNLRYIGTAICIFVILTLKGSAKISSFSPSMKYATYPLVIVAVAGSLFGRIYERQQFGALPLAIPMILLLTKFPTVESGIKLRKGSKLLIYLCLVMTVESSMVRLGFLKSSALLVFSHEKTFCMVLGLLLSIAIRSIFLTLLQFCLIAISFALYPAATVPLGVLVGLFILRFNAKLANPRRMFSAAVGFVFLIITSIFSAQAMLDSAKSYFELVGKNNNSSYRLSLVTVALEEIQKRPIFGTLFKGPATVRAYVLDRQNYQLPVHNDYVTFALCGGIFFLSLFLAMLFSLSYRVFEIHNQLSDERSRVSSAFMGSIFALLASSFANPVLMNPGNSTIFYALIMTIISLCLSGEYQQMCNKSRNLF